MSDSEDSVDLPEEGGDDLFGDGGGGGGGEDVQSDFDDEKRALSDRELASERGEEDDVMHFDDDEPPQVRDRVVMSIPMYRHRIPKSKDGQLQSLRVPPFLKWNPEEYKSESWEPSSWDIENAKSEHPVPVVRFRRDPVTGKMQSNANIYKWSDGSVTMEVGDDHYEIQTKPLAPPSDKPYQEFQDAHYYVAAAHLVSNSLLVVGHVTEQYTVRPNKLVEDDALQRLQQKLEAAKKAKTDEMIITTKEDPELQKKQAELAEKERMRAQRRRETAAARLDGISGRQNRGALSIGDLEGGRRGGAGGRRRGQHGTPRKRNRNPEYDSDDDLPAGARREDEYVLDDFAVASDDEGSEEAEEDEDEEEILDEEEEEEEAPRRKRQRTAEAGEDEDADGEADLEDVDAPAPTQSESSSRRRRHIIDDDEDEE
ncbi:hypothetical protein VTK73DRAFT_6617 [Phialemonium thermophilum]|uniref:RNA polymerase-associated protein LEO1 n=1 Tax=Phialemonium thermophilum TaxID=223376 RepID=A0ABR3XV78_9PEZI